MRRCHCGAEMIQGLHSWSWYCGRQCDKRPKHLATRGSGANIDTHILSKRPSELLAENKVYYIVKPANQSPISVKLGYIYDNLPDLAKRWGTGTPVGNYAVYKTKPGAIRSSWVKKNPSGTNYVLRAYKEVEFTYHCKLTDII